MPGCASRASAAAGAKEHSMTERKPVFTLERPMDYSDAALLAELRRAAKRIDPAAPLSRKLYDRHGRISSNAVCRRFGDWQSALVKAGLARRVPSPHGGGRVRFTAELCLENLKALWLHLGRQPVARECDAPPSTVRSYIYTQRFGSWRRAVLAFLKWSRTGRLPVPASDCRPAGTRPGRRIPAGLRHAVLKRDRYACRACGASPAKEGATTLEIDHIVPAAQGGPTTLDNLQTLCAACNRGKGGK
jgi:hypothetical protein